MIALKNNVFWSLLSLIVPTGIGLGLALLLNTAFRTHPFHTVRAAELLRWHRSGDYDAIIAGNYMRRGQDGARPLSDDYVDAAGYYGQQTRETFAPIGEAFNRARDKFNDAWRNR